MQLLSRGFELLEHLLGILELGLGGRQGRLRQFPTGSACLGPQSTAAYKQLSKLRQQCLLI
jgi:hypothetical protein